MTASPALWLLAALLGTGACLKCEVCQGPGNSCTGTLQPCEDHRDACGTALTETTVEGVTSQKIIKACMAPRQCESGLFSITHYTGVLLRMNTSCCVGDACTTPPVTLLPADTKPNYRSCSGCVYVSPEVCMDVTINCAGPETWCSYSIKETDGGATFNILHGCATKSYCAVVESPFGITSGRRFLPAKDDCTLATVTTDVMVGYIAMFTALALFLLWKLFSCLRGQAPPHCCRLSKKVAVL